MKKLLTTMGLVGMMAAASLVSPNDEAFAKGYLIVRTRAAKCYCKPYMDNAFRHRTPRKVFALGDRLSKRCYLHNLKRKCLDTQTTWHKIRIKSTYPCGLSRHGVPHYPMGVRGFRWVSVSRWGRPQFRTVMAYPRGHVYRGKTVY